MVYVNDFSLRGGAVNISKKALFPFLKEGNLKKVDVSNLHIV